MELIAGVILIAIFGVMALGFVFLVGLVASPFTKKSEPKVDEVLDEVFDGTEDVSYRFTMHSPRYEEVVLGAKKRGYRLESQTDKQGLGQVLIFTKAPANAG